MHTTRLLLIRHAEHDHRGRLWQHGCPGLTPVGREQATALAEMLSAELLDDPVLLCSRAPRALQTAELLARHLGLTVQESTCFLCEMHPGAAEGLTPDEMAAQFGPTYREVPGATHFPDWLPAGISGLRAVADAYQGRTILAVTHTAVINASFAAFDEWPFETDLDVKRLLEVRSRNARMTEWALSPPFQSGTLVRRDAGPEDNRGDRHK